MKFSKLYTKTALRIPIYVRDAQEILATDIENFMSRPQQDTSGTECAFFASNQKICRRESGRNGLEQRCLPPCTPEPCRMYKSTENFPIRQGLLKIRRRPTFKSNNLFELVKLNITTRQAAEAYGFRINRSSMICCSFHVDRVQYLLDILLQGSSHEKQQLLNGKEVTALGEAIERCKEIEEAA